jgi:hypothetical protein
MVLLERESLNFLIQVLEDWEACLQEKNGE